MSRVTKNIVHNLWGQGVLMLASLLAVSFVFKRLGADALGIIYFVVTLNGVLCSSFEMGLCNTTIRELAAHLDDDPAYVHGLIRSAALFYWAIYALLAIALWFGAPTVVSRWIHLDTLEPEPAVRAIRVLGITALLGLPRALYTSLFRGLQRMELNNVIDAAVSILQQVGTIVAILAGAQFYDVIDWLAASFVLWTMTYVIFTVSLFPVRALVPGWSMAAVRRSLRFSLNMASISALSVAHSEADKVIISRLMPMGDLGYFGVAARIVRRAGALSGAVAQAAFPALSTSVRENRAAAIAEYRKLHDLTCFGTVPLFAAVVFSAMPLFTMVFNRRIASDMLLPFALLALGQYMNATLNMPYIFSLAVGKPEIANRLNVLALFVSLPFTVVLVYEWGLTGAGLSWVVYHLFAYGYGLPRLSRECLGITVSDWLWHVGRVMALTAVTYGGAWMIVALSGQLGTKALALGFGAATLAFACGSYVLAGEQLRRNLSERMAAILWWRSQPA